MRKIITVATAAALAVGLSACGRQAEGSSNGSAAAGAKGTIGVAMPTKTSERWIKDGDYMKQQLEAAGYQVDLQYANDDIPTQVTQVNNMVTKKEQLLVVASIDGTALKGVLKQAKSAGIPVIAYDRLLRDTDAVDYYTTFDNFKVGVLQGQSLLDGLASSGAPKPWNVELFAGSPDDNNATFFFKGAMSVLQPKIDNGTLKVASGETAFNQIAILRWDAGTAKKRMENVLTKAYATADVNGVLSPYDGLSRGILAALKGAGYGSGGKNVPVITGQDAELESVKLILSGSQYSTVFKNTRDLAAATVKMIQEVTGKKQVTVNDTKSYNNGIKNVPTELLQPVLCDKASCKDVLVKANYYSDSQLSS